MKLIRCKKCDDVVRLIESKWRMCACGSCGGQYNKDMVTATIGGDCDVVGISNLFFDDEYRSLSEKEKIQYKKDIKHSPCEIWFGGEPEDEQIFRIKSPKGPRLKADVEWIGKASKLTFDDNRNYSGAGKKNIEYITTKDNPKPDPSFKDPMKSKIKENVELTNLIREEIAKLHKKTLLEGLI